MLKLLFELTNAGFDVMFRDVGILPNFICVRVCKRVNGYDMACMSITIDCSGADSSINDKDMLLRIDEWAQLDIRRAAHKVDPSFPEFPPS